MTAVAGSTHVTGIKSVDDTRSKVLQVALELFAERGYAATSTRELSERLGFTKAALYYYFHTKDDLLAALVAPALDHLERIAATPTPRSPAARRDLLRAYVEMLTSQDDRLIQVVSQDPSTRANRALKRSAELYRAILPKLTGSDDPDAGQLARARAALGGIHAALQAAPGDDRTLVRTAALAAACGALGVPAPRSAGLGRRVH